jgi:hypothetical protein
MPWQYLKLGHARFLTHDLQFNILSLLHTLFQIHHYLPPNGSLTRRKSDDQHKHQEQEEEEGGGGFYVSYDYHNQQQPFY